MDSGRQSTTSILAFAISAGVITGVVEGILRFGLQESGLLTWKVMLQGVSAEIIWIAAVFNGLLFGLIGLGFALAACFLPRIFLTRLAVFFFTFLGFFDWVMLSGHLRHLAAIVLAAGLAVVTVRRVAKSDRAVFLAARRSLPGFAALTVTLVLGIRGGFWIKEKVDTARLPAAPSGSPNILVVVVDTLRADRLSAYGYGRATSPNIDRLAQGGVLFTKAFASSSWTPPSHASLLTGRYLSEHGVEWNQPLDRRYPSLAEALRARGYRTAAFSANNIWFARHRGFGRGFIRFADHLDRIGEMITRTLYGKEYQVFGPRLRLPGIPERRRAALINELLLDWLGRNSTRPFFAFLNYLDTHAPYTPPQPYRGKFSKLATPGGRLIDWKFGTHRRLTPQQLQEEIDAYDGAIAYVDAQIADLVSELQNRRLLGNTVLVITSDHGESFGEHGLFFHQNSLYREVVHVPLLFWAPGKIPAGVRITTPVTNAALPATIIDLVAVGVGPTFPHRSLADSWNARVEASTWEDPVSEIAQQPFSELTGLPVYEGSMQSVFTPQWHYIVHSTLGEELYDSISDPDELHNLISTVEGRRVATDLAARLRALRQTARTLAEDRPSH